MYPYGIRTEYRIEYYYDSVHYYLRLRLINQVHPANLGDGYNTDNPNLGFEQKAMNPPNGGPDQEMQKKKYTQMQLYCTE